MLGLACTSSIRRSVSALPVALPPAWTIRRALCPPSSASAKLPSGSVSKPTPRATSSSTAPGASWTSASTAAVRHRPRPAAIVSRAWRSGESPGASAAASPPWAQKLALSCTASRRRLRETSTTRAPASAARSAVYIPAAPAPTTTRSASSARRSDGRAVGGGDTEGDRTGGGPIPLNPRGKLRMSAREYGSTIDRVREIPTIEEPVPVLDLSPDGDRGADRRGAGACG